MDSPAHLHRIVSTDVPMDQNPEHSGFSGRTGMPDLSLRYRWPSDAQNTVAKLERGFHKPSDDCQGGPSAGSSIRGFCWACIECQGDGIKLVTGVFGTNQYLLEVLPQQPVGVIHRPRFARAIAGRRKKESSGLCRCGVERVVAISAPLSQVRILRKAEQEAVESFAAIASRTASAPMSGPVGAVLDRGCSPWPCMRGQAQQGESVGALTERSNRLNSEPHG